MAKKDAKKTEAPAEAAAEGAEGEAPKKKGPPKIVLIGAAAAVLVLGGGGAGAFFLLGGKGEDAAAHGEKAEKKPKKKEEKGGHGKGGKGGEEGGYGKLADGPDGVVFYTLPDLVANIQTESGKTAYLKLKLTFELPDHATAEAFEPNAPRLADMFTTFLREVREEDLSGSQGTYQLRMELQRRVNLVIAPAQVNGVLIEEMLIQ